MSETTDPKSDAKARAESPRPPKPAAKPEEFGGPKGPEPTRYGDWQQKGRVSDF
jgi:hypothetical protein